MSIAVKKTIPVIFGFALVLLVLINGATYRSLIQTQQTFDWETHSREVQLHVEEMKSALLETESASRGYLLLGREDMLQNFYTTATFFRKELQQLRALTADNPAHQELLQNLQNLAEQKIAVSQKYIDIYRLDGTEKAFEEIGLGESKRLMDEIQPLIRTLQQEENRLLQERRTELQTQTRNTLIIILSGSILGILSLAIANYVIVRQLSQRQQAETALAKANAQLEQRIAEQSKNLSKTSDELRLENIRRALAEKNERAQREWWRVTLNSIGDCVITTDIGGKINFLNQMAQNVIGWNLSEALELPAEKVFTIVNEYSLQPVENPITKVLREGIIMGLASPTTLVTKDGRNLSVDANGAPIRDDEGTIIGAVLVFRDLTSQRTAEIKLRRVEELQRLALEAGKMGVFALNPYTDELEIDGRIRNLYGKKDDDKIEYAASLFDGVYSEDRPVLEQNIKNAVEKQTPFQARFRVQLPDGKKRWIAGVGQVETDTQGRTILLRGLNYDITEQVEAEERLRESEQFNRSIFENSPDCVKILELDGTLHSMNANGMRLMEIDDFAIYLGRQWIDFWPDETRALVRNALTTAAQGKTANFQGPCSTAKGTFKWWDISVAPILNGEGKPMRLVATSRDITDRKEQENALRINELRFRTLTETIPQLVWACSSDGQCTYLSNRWMEYTGTSLEQNHGYGWFQFLHPNDVTQTQETWQQAVAASDSYQTEIRLRRADGVYRWHLARAVKVRDDASNTVKWIGTFTDLEDHKRAEAERLELLEREQVLRSKAEESNRLKDEFVATVSHELRTPLNAILGWARMMRAGTLDAATTRKAIDVIERSAENQARLIDDLLDMSRIITGKLRLDIKMLDPTIIVRAALETVMPMVKAKEITLHSELDPHVNAIAGDANRLQQVIWNLLSNAIKFTPRGGLIQVQLKQAKSQVVFTVSDNGQGIDPEFLPYVFDRFRQADASSIRKHGGLGLGLSIAHHLVELHGGSIKVESQGINLGATFTVQLPISPIHLNGQTETQPSLSVNLPLPNAEPILNGLFILAVDDEADARQLLAQILTAYGATVITTDTADSALEIIKQQHPDLLVSDIGMPNNDGYFLIRSVRELEQDQANKMPAIALTAYARPRDRMQALAAGFNHHVPKPVEPTELVTVISSVTGRLDIHES